jgi:uncharacterized pyridoxamine 5'-phosphate oxidase family protein
MVTVEEVLGYFKPVNHIILATIDEDQPRLRPITLVHYKKRFFFATQTKDNKVKQLKKNPKIELILLWEEPPNNGYIRVEGTVEKTHDPKLIAELYHEYDFLEKLWNSPVDPNLIVYEVNPMMLDYLKPGEWNTLKLRIK